MSDVARAKVFPGQHTFVFESKAFTSAFLRLSIKDLSKNTMTSSFGSDQSRTGDLTNDSGCGGYVNYPCMLI